jgi:hypothetical protein
MQTSIFSCHTFATFCLLVIIALPVRMFGQEEAKTTVSGFLDVYYLYSLMEHPLRDRSFTTQPLRHNEFNLNLGMIDVKYQANSIRGRLALQTGTYVQSNLAAEAPLMKHVLEASAGTRIADGVWIDLGIYPSHIGFEGIVSKDNWTYSRSLLSDYSPFYESGLKLSAVLSDQLTLCAHVLNGWQNIAETNDDKAVGTQLTYKPTENVLFNWSTFAGNEQPDSVAARLRAFNDLYVVFSLSSRVSIAVVFDIGAQKRSDSDIYDTWHTAALMARYAFSDQWALAARAEYFHDRTGILIPTGTPNNFQTASASVNIDYSPTPILSWRLEARLFNSKDPVYPTQNGTVHDDGFLVLSTAISM